MQLPFVLEDDVQTVCHSFWSSRYLFLSGREKLVFLRVFLPLPPLVKMERIKRKDSSDLAAKLDVWLGRERSGGPHRLLKIPLPPSPHERRVRKVYHFLNGEIKS